MKISRNKKIHECDTLIKKHHQGSRSQEMAPRLSTPNSTRLTDTTGWFELIKSLCYVCGQATTEWGPTFSIDWKLGNQIYAPVTLPLWPQPIYSKTVHCMRLSTKLHGQQWPHWLRNSTVILQVCGGQQRLCGRLRLPSKWGERKEEKKSVKMKKKRKTLKKHTSTTFCIFEFIWWCFSMAQLGF